MKSLSTRIDEARSHIQMVNQPVWALFSGGKDSIAAAHIAQSVGKLEGVIHIVTRTGPASQIFSEYAINMARSMGWEVIVKSPAISYEMLVAEFGFPGPAQHSAMYRYLKERPLREAVKVANKKTRRRFALVSGIRREESARRANADAVHKQDGRYWVNPLVEWNTEEVLEYLRENQLDHLIKRKSRECLCGAFARPGEKEEVEKECPEQSDYWYYLETMVSAAANVKQLQNQDFPEYAKVWGHGLNPTKARTNEPNNTLSICSVCDGQLDQDGNVGIDPDEVLWERKLQLLDQEDSPI